MENAKREFYENGNVKVEYQINNSDERDVTVKLFNENSLYQMNIYLS